MTACEPTDRALLERFRGAGDEEAFRLLLVRHEGWVRHQCRRMLRDEDTADEACQAVFVLLSRRASDIRDGACLAAWLQQVAHGITCNLIDARRRQRRHPGLGADEILAEVPADHAEDDEQLIAAQAFLPDCLAELQPIDREVVIRHYLKCQQQAAIAAEMGLSVGAVQKRVARAIVRLRALMQQRGVILAPALLMAICSPARAEASSELVEATMSLVRQGSHLEGPVARLARLAESQHFAAGSWSLAHTVAASLAFAGALAGAAVIGWWWSAGASQADARGMRIVAAEAGSSVQDAQGVHRSPAAGQLLTPGTTVQSSAAGDVVVRFAGGHWTLRAGGRAEVASDGVILHSGAVLFESDSTGVLRIDLPRMRVQPQGRAWVLALPAFDRIDVVAGTAEVTTEGTTQRLHADQALARGPGCPATAMPRSPEELSPDFGGLFFRPVAGCYATRRNLLAQGPGTLDVQRRVPMDAALLAEAQHPATGLTATLEGGALLLRHAGDATEPAHMGMPWSGWASDRVQVVQTTGDFAGRVQVNDAAIVDDYAACPWRDLAVPDAVGKPPTIRTAIDGFIHASIQVGVAPDGRAVWEKTLANRIEGPWLPPTLCLGGGPQGSHLVFQPGAALRLRAVVFAQGQARAALTAHRPTIAQP